MMDYRWAQSKKAGQTVDPVGFNVNGDVAVENGKLNTYVDSKIKKGWLVGDPGKIWALTNRIGPSKAGLPTACNYGWHVASSKVAVKAGNPKEGTYAGGPVKAAVASLGEFCVQWEEHGHNTAWIDYSQLLILASGWCVVKAPGEKDFKPIETAKVYTDPKMFVLVSHDGKPLKFTKQPLTVPKTASKGAAKKAQLEKDLEERRFRLARIESRKSGGAAAAPQGEPGPEIFTA
ncbi:MAG: hypothetical protein R3F14_28290 [Polyangiaceae bacterium]